MLLPCLVWVASIAGCPRPTPETDGTLAGTVTNDVSGSGIAGVTVTLDPAVEGVDITTGADGTYAAQLPAGDYEVTFAADNYEPQSQTISITVGDTTTVNIALVPTDTVLLSASVAGDATPGATLTATANVTVLDGSTIQSYAWTQTHSVSVDIGSPTAASTAVTLPALATYKEELFSILSEPPLTAEQLPPNVPFPTDEESEGRSQLLDRFYIVGLNPFVLEEANLITLEVTVTTSSGTYTADVDIDTALPWTKTTSGVTNVPIGETVLLHGKTQDSYDWALDDPSGSSAALTDATTQNPYFTPDINGKYTVSVTQLADPNDPNSVDEDVTLEIYAGTWGGAITGEDTNGLPEADICMLCHSEQIGIAPDLFTPWRQTGHAVIFSDNLDTSDHYSTSCLVCHTVGYDPDVDNGGFDDASDYDDFLAEFATDGTIHSAPGNWAAMLDNEPDTAQLANIQCESCHGPQNTPAHGKLDPRISLSADVCGVCHGEPARHGRFQQWQLSGHADYDLAISEGQSGSCARCHTANGFLTWLPIVEDDDPNTDPSANIAITWTEDETHPITCQVCHDPHSVGTISGAETDAPMRVEGDTPELLAGFAVSGAGKGAMCMVCHNTRNGLHNEGVFADIKADGGLSRAPHTPSQTDVIEGQNAFLVDVGVPGGHAFVGNVCVSCHMIKTPPPDLLAYQAGGTNHTFFAAPDICAQCHGELVDASGVQNLVEGDLENLKSLIEDAISALFSHEIDAGNKIDLDGTVVTDMADIDSIAFTEVHGRQGLEVTLADSTVLELRMSDISVLDAADTNLGELYDFTGTPDVDYALPKAGWNYFLLHGDGSLGVHNPGFVLDVLSASTSALNAFLDSL